ncbi:MAG: RNA polymerase sigma factor [Lachnospiraceae bacterium]|nr:RNA polymerase sigma factor [Lachnospiraceae bacterium]
MEDEKIVELYLQRDEEAIVQTRLKYGKCLLGIANNILHNIETAEECENDTYLRTWNSIPPNEPKTYFFSYIGRIIRNIAIDIVRKDANRKKYVDFCELTEELQECLPSKHDTEKEIEMKCLTEIINGFLKTRPEHEQIIFSRRYWYFEKVDEIAKACGYSVSKVKTVLFRLRKKLKKHLKERGYDI